MKKTLLMFTFAVAVATPSAFGGQIVGAATGLTNPGTTITFDQIVLNPGTPLTTQYAALGVTFSSLFYNSEDISVGNVVSPVAENFGLDYNVVNPFSIFFTTPQTDAAVTLITNDGEITTFEAYFRGGRVDGFTAPTGIAGVNNYYGFTGTLFDELRFSVSYDYNGAAAMGAIQFGSGPDTDPVPEPATLSFMAIGVASILVASRRRKRGPAAA